MGLRRSRHALAATSANERPVALGSAFAGRFSVAGPCASAPAEPVRDVNSIAGATAQPIAGTDESGGAPVRTRPVERRGVTCAVAQVGVSGRLFGRSGVFHSDASAISRQTRVIGAAQALPVALAVEPARVGADCPVDAKTPFLVSGRAGLNTRRRVSAAANHQEPAQQNPRRSRQKSHSVQNNQRRGVRNWTGE